MPKSHRGFAPKASKRAILARRCCCSNAVALSSVSVSASTNSSDAMAELPPDEVLIELWHSRESVAVLSKLNGTSQPKLLREWKRLKHAGKLPAIARPSGNLPQHDSHDGRPAVGSL